MTLSPQEIKKLSAIFSQKERISGISTGLDNYGHLMDAKFKGISVSGDGSEKTIRTSNGLIRRFNVNKSGLDAFIQEFHRI